MRKRRPGVGAGLLCWLALVPSARAQGPVDASFTYQGSLTVSGTPGNGAYDFEFVLYDAPVGGAPIGPIVTHAGVPVTDGLFTVILDFGSVFGVGRRWLEPRVRAGGSSDPFTPVLPRQEVTSAPHATFSSESANAGALGGLPPSEFVRTGDPRLSDARVPLPGSPDYVQNGTVPQAGVSFNVGGTGAAGVLDAVTQYDLGGARVLGMFSNNLYVGTGTGTNSFGGTSNTFVGTDAGRDNTVGSNNTYFGTEAGRDNTASQNNSMFGSRSGQFNTGASNAFFGVFTGAFNTTGASNALFGAGAGNLNTTGSGNTFIGETAGRANTTGNDNTFVGRDADSSGSTGEANTLLGARTRVTHGLASATAIGYRAAVAQSNAIVLGAVEGVNGATASTNVGIGTTAPSARLHVVDGLAMLFGASPGCPGVVGIALGGLSNNNCQNYALFGGDGSTYINRPASGAGGIFFRAGNVTQVSIGPSGVLRLPFVSGGGATPMCRNAANDIGFCSSSLRYKEDVSPLGDGLAVVSRLRPIRFTWTASGQRDVGLAAEEVAKVDPLLVFRNAEGEIEGVNDSQLTAVLVRALQQQQAQIDALKALVCEAQPQAPPCLDP